VTGFLLAPGRPIKIFGAGLASAVFLDAFILRTALVPSLMHISGNANWYFPRRLDQVLPRVSAAPPRARAGTGGARLPQLPPLGQRQRVARAGLIAQHASW
jgi:putative drug exporter of the RND superfamily